MAIWAFLKKWDVQCSNATVELVQQEEVFSLTVVLTLFLTLCQYHEKKSE